MHFPASVHLEMPSTYNSSQMGMALFRPTICSQGVPVLLRIRCRTLLYSRHVDAYDARCAGTSHWMSMCSCKHQRSIIPRQELASRENMLDHGQLGPPTPALPSLTPTSSRRSSSSNEPSTRRESLSRKSSTRLNVSISRRPSNANTNVQSSRPTRNSSFQDGRPAILSALGGRSLLESLSMSALDTEDDDNAKAGAVKPLGSLSRRSSNVDSTVLCSSPVSMNNLGRDLSDALDASALELETDVPNSATESDPGPPQPTTQSSGSSSQYANSADLAAQVYSSPKLAALRTSSSLLMTSISGYSAKQTFSPPILVNPKCSGYFLEPVCGHCPVVASTKVLPF